MIIKTINNKTIKIPQKKKKRKKRKTNKEELKWFAKYYFKSETLLNDESQRIPTTNLQVKDQHGVQRQIQENLNEVYSL